MAGEKLSEVLPEAERARARARMARQTAVKESVFPFDRFPGVDVLLGPEMRSTGEVMGLANDFPTAFYKAQIAAHNALPKSGTAFVSVRDRDKQALLPIARGLIELGFRIVSTQGTARHLSENGIAVERVNKVAEGRPHVVDRLEDRAIDLVINTTQGKQAIDDSRSIRRQTLLNGIPYFTDLAGARVAVQAMARVAEHGLPEPRALQEYLK